MKKIIRHAEIDIDGSVIMFADSTDMYQPRTTGLFIYVENADETYKTVISMKVPLLFQNLPIKAMEEAAEL